MATLEERQDIVPSTRNVLSNILEVMKQYRHRGLVVFSVFIISWLLLLIYFFVLVSTNTFGLVTIVGQRIVSGQGISLVLGCVPVFSVFVGVFVAMWLLRKGFRKRISSMLASMNSDELSSLVSE
jgi:uncharacterized membrane protein